jgi:ABC-type uncharacterized transport system fused permease/ATPase subunit
MNTVLGIRQVDPKLVELGHVTDLSNLQLIRRIILPGALPSPPARLASQLRREGKAMTQRENLPAVIVQHLKRTYGSRTVIQNPDLRIERGEFVVLLGESGCGKTTLLRALAGLDPTDGGRIDGPSRPAVVFQEHRLLPWDSLWRSVALGLEQNDNRARASAALAEVGLGDRLDD